MKILVIQIPTAKKDSPYYEYSKNVYCPMLKRGFDAALQRDDVEYTFRTCEWGLVADVPIYDYCDTLTRRQVFYAGVNAEEEGFDAVFVDCMGDPMLDELRQAIDIPVVGMGESSMIMSTLMGRKYAFVMPSQREVELMPEVMFKYGTLANCTGSYALPAGADMMMAPALEDAREFLPMFEEVCRKAVAEGAEVVLPGCCLISIVCSQAPKAQDAYPNGLKTVDGAVVMDLLGASMLTLEALVKLKKAGSPWISRKQKYMIPPAEHKEKMRNVTQDPSLTYWDIVL